MYSAIAQATVSTSSSGSGWAIVASILASVIWLVVVVVLVAAVWKLFAKAGRPGWAALIPLYNTITMLQITGRSPWWILGLCVPFLNLFVAIRLVFDLARVYGRSVAFGFGLLFLFPIFLLILAFGKATYVGPDNNRMPPIAAGGFASAPIAP